MSLVAGCGKRQENNKQSEEKSGSFTDTRKVFICMKMVKVFLFDFMIQVFCGLEVP